jgi:hypothetical protein
MIGVNKIVLQSIEWLSFLLSTVLQRSYVINGLDSRSLIGVAGGILNAKGRFGDIFTQLPSCHLKVHLGTSS